MIELCFWTEEDCPLWEKSSLVGARTFPPRCGNVDLTSSLTFRKRLYACRRKISPMTGRKYSLLAKLELARRLSALDQSRFSISPMFPTVCFLRLKFSDLALGEQLTPTRLGVLVRSFAFVMGFPRALISLMSLISGLVGSSQSHPFVSSLRNIQRHPIRCASIRFSAVYL